MPGSGGPGVSGSVQELPRYVPVSFFTHVANINFQKISLGLVFGIKNIFSEKAPIFLLGLCSRFGKVLCIEKAFI